MPGESGIAGITAGPDGNLWFTQNDLGQVGIDDADRARSARPTRRLPYPFGITAGPDGNIWFCEGFGNAVGRLKLS